MPSKELVNFLPYDAEGWRDSHEGGLFVKMVVPKPEDWSEFCYTDAHIHLAPSKVGIKLGGADVCLTPNELWTPFEETDYRSQSDVYQYLRHRADDDLSAIKDVKDLPVWHREFHEGFQYQKWASWALRTLPWDDLSETLLAAVELGSSSWSMWNDAEGRYWTATLDDLTEEGRAVYDSLHTAFGIEPLLLTFLDT